MSPEPGASLRALLAAVRGRWRRLIAFRAIVRAGLAVTGVIAVALVLSRWMALTALSRTPVMLAALGVIVLFATISLVAWALRPVRETPSDARVARFIEEAVPSLDDRL